MRYLDNENSEEIVGYMVSPDGVIQHDIHYGDKLVTRSQLEYSASHILNFQKKEAFVKVFTDPIIPLYKELSTKEFAVAMSIIPFISYTDGVLRYEGWTLDVKTLANLYDENYQTYAATIHSLIEKEVLNKITMQSDIDIRPKKCLVANPYIFLKGQDVATCIVEYFQNSKWAQKNSDSDTDDNIE